MTLDKKAEISRNLDSVVNVLLSQKAKSSSIKDGDIISEIQKCLEFIDPTNVLEESDIENLVKTLQSRFSTTMDFGSLLVDEQFEQWLNEAQLSIDHYYWESYEQMLSHEYKFSKNVIQEIDYGEPPL